MICIAYPKAQISVRTSPSCRVAFESWPDVMIKRPTSDREAAKKMEDQDSVDVYLGSPYSKGFFGWAVPAGDLSRIGSGIRA